MKNNLKKVLTTYVSIEFIVFGRQDHFSQIFTDPRHSGKVDPIVVDAQ